MDGSYLGRVVLVAAGGFVGSGLRFMVGGWVHRAVPFATFPWGTLTVNIAGCLAIGVLAGLADLRQLLAPDTRLFLLVGVLGGFTTFSTFALESLSLAQEHSMARALGNVSTHLVLGLGAVWLGYALSRLG